MESSVVNNNSPSNSRSVLSLCTTEGKPITSETLAVVNKLANQLNSLKDTALSQNNKKNAKKISQAISLLENVQLKLNSLITTEGEHSTLSTTDTAFLSSQLEKTSQLLNKSDTKTLTALLGQYFFASWLNQARSEIKTDVFNKLKGIGNPGAANSTTLKIEVKGGGNIVATNLYGSIGYSHTDTLDSDDEGLFFRSKTRAASLGLTAGIKVIAAKLGGNLTGSHAYTTFKEYNNVKTYVDMEVSNLASLNRDDTSLTKTSKQLAWQIISKVFAGPQHSAIGSELKQYHQQLQAAVNNQHKLNTLLSEQLGIDSKVNVTLPVIPETLSGYVNTTSASATGSASIGINGTELPLAASAGINVTLRRTEIYEFVPAYFWTVIAENAQRLKELPASLTTYAKTLLNQDSANKSIVDRSTHALATLNSDFDRYMTVVQKYDAGDQSSRGEKHAIESRWGVQGRHEFLQAIHASYTLLADRIWNANTTPEQFQQATALLDTISKNITQPTITYSKSKLENIASFKQLIRLSITDKSFSLSGSVGNFGLEATVLHRNRIHPSRLRHGDYIDIYLSFKAGITSGDVTGFIDNMVSKIKGQYDATVDSEQIKNTLSDLINNHVDASASGKFTLQLRYFKAGYQHDYGDNHYHKQFSRYLFTHSANLGVNGEVPVGGGASVGGKIGIAHSNTEVLKESPTADTLSYVLTRYNRWYRNKETEGEWQDYFKDHKTEFSQLFKQLGNADTTAFLEAQHWLQELISTADTDKAYFQTLQEAFNTAMNAYREDSSEQAFNTAKHVFNQFMSEQITPWWNAHRSHWQDLPFQPKRSFLEKLAKRLSSFPDQIKDSFNQLLKSNAVLPQQDLSDTRALTKALTLDDQHLLDSFLLVYKQKGLSAATSYTRNILALGYQQWLQPDQENVQASGLTERVKQLPSLYFNAVNNGQGAKRLRKALEPFTEAGVLKLRVDGNDLALLIKNKSVTLFNVTTSEIVTTNTIRKAVDYISSQYDLKQQTWSLAHTTLDQTISDTLITQISRPYVTDLDLLAQADKNLGLLPMGEQHISRIELWLAGAKLNNVTLTTENLISLSTIDGSLTLNADQTQRWMKQLDGNQRYTALARLNQWLTASPALLPQNTNSVEIVKLRKQAEAINWLDHQLPLLSSLDEKLNRSLASVSELHDRQQRLFGSTPVPNQKLNKLASKINGVNTAMSVIRLPGNIYQTVDAFAQGDTYHAVQSLADTLTDNLDITLDVLANSTKVQAVSTRLASVATKLGAITNFAGAGLGIWSAVDNFNAAATTTNTDERIDYIVNGSLAVAGVIVSIATGIASLITAAAGPIGAAIGLAIGIAASIYNTVRVRQQLAEAGITGSDLDLAGAAVFFGFPVPEHIANKAATNIGERQWNEMQQKRLEMYAQLGVDKLVYSTPKVFTAYGKLTNISEGYDYYNLSPAELREYHRNNPGEVDSGWVFRQEPKAAQVKKLDTYNEEDGVTLIQLGKGFDWANGDLNRRNIFLIDHNRSAFQRRYKGGNKADTFEIRSPNALQRFTSTDYSIVDGGAGIDTISFRSMYAFTGKKKGLEISLDPHSHFGNKGTVQIRDGRQDFFLIENIENVIGSEGNDEIIGNRLSNFLQGSEGDDVISGLYGDDHLVGGQGSDYLSGGEGTDTYTITADDWETDTDHDTIDNKVEAGEQFYRVKLDYLAEHPEASDEEAKLYAYQHTPKSLATDQLITNFGDLSGYKENDDLKLTVSQGWLNALRLAKRLFLSHQAGNDILQLTDELSLTNTVLSHIKTALATTKDHWELLTSESFKSVLDHYQENAPTRINVITLTNYFKGKQYQHIQFRDLAGHLYIPSLQTDGQVIFDTLVTRAADEGHYKVNLNNGYTHLFNGDVQQRFNLLSTNITNVIGSKEDDTLRGNNLDNLIDGGAGFDQLFGEDGNDILVSGADGAQLSGGNGHDTYMIGANQNMVVITSDDTDNQRDTISFQNGFNGFSHRYSAEESRYYLNYQGTEIILGNRYQQNINKKLTFAFQSTTQSGQGILYGTFNEDHKFQLSELDLTAQTNDGYTIDVGKQAYQSSSERFELSYPLMSLFKLRTGDGDDTLYTGKHDGVLIANLGAGNNTVNMNKHSSIIYLEQSSHTTLTVQWENLDWNDFKVLYKEGNLSLINKANSDQALILNKTEDASDLSINIIDKNHNSHSVDINLLIQMASQMSESDIEGITVHDMPQLNNVLTSLVHTV
ncbi:hypothetical protein [Zooshikella sp. RANM57]|uniref:hypothetical protein n=1 Tax=Zooshikella sp. RANM57 TaxID=3425863 RepID=UPI003D6EEDCF